MSQDNVEIVKGIAPPSGTDLTRLFADDAGASDRLAAAWREWMSPFETWWTEIEGFVDIDEDRVLVLLRDHVRPREGESEIESLGCNLWTLRDGKVVRIDVLKPDEHALDASGHGLLDETGNLVAGRVDLDDEA